MRIEKLNNENKHLFAAIEKLSQRAGEQAAVYLNGETNRLYWSIGQFIKKELKHELHSGYGKQILATLSQELSSSRPHMIEKEGNNE
ncbi:MAG: DUF1016 N-terminal domain-containing protein [Sphingobacterium sp.]